MVWREAVAQQTVLVKVVVGLRPAGRPARPAVREEEAGPEVGAGAEAGARQERATRSGGGRERPKAAGESAGCLQPTAGAGGHPGQV